MDDFVGEGKRASLMPVADNRFYFFLDVPLPAGLENDRSQYQAFKTIFKTGAHKCNS
jgi:FAD-dependent urate hydroxylase